MKTPKASVASGQPCPYDPAAPFSMPAATPDREREDLGDRSFAASIEPQATIPNESELKELLAHLPWFERREALNYPRPYIIATRALRALSALSKARSAGNQDVRDAIWNEAVEACAEHHDKMALHFIEQSKILLPEEAIYEAVRLAADHQRHAAAIRLFKHSPKAGQEDPDIERMMRGDLR